MNLAVILSGIFLAGPALAMPLPDCAGEVAVAKAMSRGWNRMAR
jgi:hypothetical protein